MMKRIVLILVISSILVLYTSTCLSARKRSAHGPIVKKITIVGATYFSEKEIKKLMRTRQSRLFRKRRFRMSTLESDLFSICALYRRNGFLSAKAELAEVTYDEERTSVSLTIRIIEGEQTIVKQVTFEGNNVISDEELTKLVRVKPGSPLNEDDVGQDDYAIYALYADRGYIFASVMHSIEGKDGQATVIFRIREGNPVSIGSIGVRGNRDVSAELIRRELTVQPGERISRKKLLESQQRLYDTGFFKDVEIEPSPTAQDSGIVNLIVRVKERDMREVSIAVGYGTREEARATLGWMHRNLFGTGRQVEVRLIGASKDFSKGLTRKRGDLTISDRWLFGRRLTGAIGTYTEESVEEYKEEEVQKGEYTLDRIGIDGTLKKEFSRSTRLIIGYSHEFVQIRNPTWQVEDPEQLRIKIGHEINRSAWMIFERDTRLPFFDPHRGSLTRVTARLTGGPFGGDNSYTKATASWARYLSFYGRSVLAVSVRVGFAEAFGVSKDRGVPEYERFFVGGASTIRGYDEREFGPGDFMLIANIEVRYPLVWKLTGVAFMDMGNVWESIDDLRKASFDVLVSSTEFTRRRPTDCKYSVGFGLGIQTPVGPARLDYGMRLKRAYTDSGRKEPAGVIHITIGHAF